MICSQRETTAEPVTNESPENVNSGYIDVVSPDVSNDPNFTTRAAVDTTELRVSSRQRKPTRPFQLGWMALLAEPTTVN